MQNPKPAAEFKAIPHHDFAKRLVVRQGAVHGGHTAAWWNSGCKDGCIFAAYWHYGPRETSPFIILI